MNRFHFSPSTSLLLSGASPTLWQNKFVEKGRKGGVLAAVSGTGNLWWDIFTFSTSSFRIMMVGDKSKQWVDSGLIKRGKGGGQWFYEQCLKTVELVPRGSILTKCRDHYLDHSGLHDHTDYLDHYDYDDHLDHPDHLNYQEINIEPALITLFCFDWFTWLSLSLLCCKNALCADWCIIYSGEWACGCTSRIWCCPVTSPFKRVLLLNFLFF